MDQNPRSVSKFNVFGSTPLLQATHLVVRGNEPEYVVVAQHAGLVDLHLAHPGPLVNAGEDLDRHVLATPLTPPNLTKPYQKKTVGAKYVQYPVVDENYPQTKIIRSEKRKCIGSVYSKSINKYSKLKYRYRISTMNILCLIFLAHILRRSK